MTQSDTPGEGLARVHCEHCPARFNTVWEREQHERESHWPISPFVLASDTAGLPSDCAGLVAVLEPFAKYAEIYDEAYPTPHPADLQVAAAISSPYAINDAFDINLGHCRRAREAIAALSRATEAVVVKPLEWFGNDPEKCHSRGGLYSYAIAHDGDEPEEWSMRRDLKLISYHETEKDARKAAQADYERRILSALVAPPAPQPALALIEELTGALIAVRARFQHLRLGPDEEAVLDRVATALASAKRFKEGA